MVCVVSSSATTHSDLVLRAVNDGIPYRVIHNASIMNAVGCCGLQVGLNTHTHPVSNDYKYTELALITHRINTYKHTNTRTDREKEKGGREREEKREGEKEREGEGRMK